MRCGSGYWMITKRGQSLNDVREWLAKERDLTVGWPAKTWRFELYRHQTIKR